MATQLTKEIQHSLNLTAPSDTPAYLQNISSATNSNLVVAMGHNRIGLKGSRFRLIVGGQEELVVEENYLDAIIVGTSPSVSRIFYEGTYVQGEKKAPTCYSVDGEYPAEDVVNKQSDKCASCPQNVKGSRVGDGGQLSKACSYFKRLVLILPSEPDRLYQLDCKGLTLFGESQESQNRWSIKDFGTKLRTRGIDVARLITRISFDTDSSVPKLLFQPKDWIPEELVEAVSETLAREEDINAMLAITAQTVDRSSETSPSDSPEAPAPVVEAPAQSYKPAPPRAAPVAARPAPVAPTQASVQAPVQHKAPPVTKVAAGPTVTRAPVVTKAPSTANGVTAPAVDTSESELAAMVAELGIEDDGNA